MTLTPPFAAAFATLFAAGIAATVSLVVSILSKEQKTSEFRQQWIDALRTDIAEWIAEITMLYALSIDLKDKDVETTERALETRFPNLVKVRLLTARIELRLNPGEHREMFDAINALRDVDASTELSVVHRRLSVATKASQKILKEEWVRVKQGEKAFIWTKRVAVAIVALAVVAAAALVVRAW